MTRRMCQCHDNSSEIVHPLGLFRVDPQVVHSGWSVVRIPVSCGRAKLFAVSEPAQPAKGVPPVRFLLEIVAWTAAPWALASRSIVLAVASVLVLIGLPTLFSTPGDKKHVIVAVPGVVTIALVVLHIAVAAVASRAAWPLWAAIVVWALCAATVVTELPRWRWLLTRTGAGR